MKITYAGSVCMQHMPADQILLTADQFTATADLSKILQIGSYLACVWPECCIHLWYYTV